MVHGVCMELLDNILAHTFSTADDPLKIKLPKKLANVGDRKHDPHLKKAMGVGVEGEWPYCWPYGIHMAGHVGGHQCLGLWPAIWLGIWPAIRYGWPCGMQPPCCFYGWGCVFWLPNVAILPHGEWNGTDDQASLLACSVGYVKGQARSLTMLAIAAIAQEANLHIKELDWELWQSMRVVWAKFPYHANLQSEFFHNLKISNAGSIRKAANCITWVWGIQMLRKEGSLHGK